MPIEFRCTICQRLLRVPDGASGQQARCPGCGAVTTVPSIGAGPSQTAAPADAEPGKSPFGTAGPAPTFAADSTPVADSPPAPSDRRDAPLPETLWAPSPFASTGPKAGENPFAGGPPPTPPDTDNPYASPSAESLAARPVAMDVYAYAAMKVQTPAVGLIVTGSIGLAGLAVAMFGMGFGILGEFGGVPKGEEIFMLAVMIGLMIVNGSLNLLLIVGGLKMKRLENYRFAMAAAIAAIVPFACLSSCFGGCSLVLGWIFGIWALIVLSNGQVRAAFDQAAGAAGAPRT